jgi:hypothetical protein
MNTDGHRSEKVGKATGVTQSFFGKEFATKERKEHENSNFHL